MSEWIAIEDGCVWPKAETIVEVKLHNGFVGLAMFDCNIQDAGDWDLMPLDERGVAGVRDSVADQAVAWRESTALDRLSGRVTVSVKPLEWDVHIDRPDVQEYYAGDQNNLAGDNEYIISPHPCATGYFVIDCMGRRANEDYPSVEAAKAAAQADFEARILAAIETAPARDPWLLQASDDGTEIHLSGYAGGAAPCGAWSTLTLLRCRPGQPTEFRSYTADGDWSSDAPQAAIDTSPAPSPDQIRREALTLIERLYYIEGKDAEWRAARMNSVAREAQSPEPNLSRFHRIFPRSVFTGGDDDHSNP